MPSSPDHFFVTGFPGFLAGRLLPRLLDAGDGGSVLCLVERRMADAARSTLDSLLSLHPHLAGRIRLTEGDITRSELFVNAPDTATVTRVYHLAAAYHLGVDRVTANAVNVEGTRNVLAFASRLPRLTRIDYVSTCYVSGRHPGIFRETDLDVGQKWDNHYEETKFRAELLVKEASDDGLPTAIYRPSIVAGDARTGATTKYDGPYYLMQWMLAQGGRVALVPRPPGARGRTMNVVPSDFVIEAMAALADRADAVGKTFQLADPEPLDTLSFIRAVGDALHIRPLPVPMPLTFAGWFLALASHLPGFPAIPKQAAPYLSHPTRYDTSRTRKFLEPEGITAPRFDSYVQRLAEFVNRHPREPAPPPKRFP